MPSRRQVLAGLGSASATVLAGCLDAAGLDFGPGTDAETDWPMPRYDHSNTAYSPDARAPRDGVRERWTTDLSLSTGTPAVVDGTVFLPTAEALVALDADDGSEVWRFAPGREPWFSAPTVHDGLVFVAGNDEERVYALDAGTGEERWSVEGDSRASTAPHLVTGEYVPDPGIFVGDDAGVLRRLDPTTGDEQWRVDLFGAISAVGYRPPQLFVGTGGGEVYSFVDWGEDDQPREGWRRKVGSKVEAVVPNAQCVAVHTFGGPFRCLQDGAHAGTTRWSEDAKWANSPPVHAEGLVIAAGYDGAVALRDYDRKTLWRIRGRYDRAGPVAAGDTLYASSGDAVHAFALDGGTGVGRFRVGAERWSHPTPAGVTGLAVADGAVFAVSQGSEEDDTSLYCLEPA